MGNPKSDSGEQKKNSNSGSDQSGKGGVSKSSPAKLPPAGFIYSDDEDLMGELSMGWGLTASDDHDELDAIIDRTVDMGKVSNTKLKALTEPPKGGVERIERVRAERASKEVSQSSLTDAVESREKSEKEIAARKAREQAAEREAAARAAEQREKAERELAARDAAEREARIKARQEEEAAEQARLQAEAEERERLEAEKLLAQEEAEAATILERAEQEARERAEEEEAHRKAAERAARDQAEREEAEREILERERIQKEAAAKLRAKKEEAKREAEEQARLEQEAAEIAAKEAAEKDAKEKEKEAALVREKAGKGESAKPEKRSEAAEDKSETAKSSKEAERLARLSKDRGDVKPQKIGFKKDDKQSETNEASAEKESSSTGTTARLSRTPEEELAALLAEDDEPQPVKDPVKPVKNSAVPDPKVSRSGLTAMEPTDDTPLTGMLKAIKPGDASKSYTRMPVSAEANEKVSVDAAHAEETESKAEELESKSDEDLLEERHEAPETIEEAPSSDAAETVDDVSETEADTEFSEQVVSEAESQSFDGDSSNISEAGGLLSSEIVSPTFESGAGETSIEEPSTPVARETFDASILDKIGVPEKAESQSKSEKSDSKKDVGEKPGRVKLGDFVRKVREPASAETAGKAEKEQPAVAEKTILEENPLPSAAELDAIGRTDNKQSKNDVKESTKADSPEKKAALIAALKKLEDQVDESNLDSLSTDSLKDVLAKLPDMSSAPASSTGKDKAAGRGKAQSPAVARLASKDESGPDRDVAREKLKVMQKMSHQLPDVKSYLPQKKALVLITAITVIGVLSAVLLVRANTISARQALQNKDYKGALSSLGLVLAIYPFSAEGHFLKGSALYLTGNLSEAHTEYDTALKLSPDMRDALERRAAVNYRLGNYQEAIADYESLLQKEDVQSQRFDQFLSLANAYLRHGDLQKALDMYNRCLERKPNYVPAFLGKIAIWNERKMYERATSEASKALASNPDNKDLLILRARAYTGKKNFGAAQKDIDTLLKKNPKNGMAYTARAHLRLAQNKEAEAYADFEKASKLSPKDATILLERAHAYINDRKFDLAVKDIAKAKSLMGAQQAAQLYLLNARALSGNKQQAKAMEELKSAEERFPLNTDVLFAKADLLASSNKVGEALSVLEKAIDMDKSDADAHLRHGLLSLKFGNKMRAEEDLDEVLRLDPKSAAAFAARGQLYIQQEKFASAQEDLSKAISLDPSNAEAKAAMIKAKTAFAKLTRVRSTGVQREGPSDAYLASLATKDFNTLLNDGYAAYKRGDMQTAVPTLEQAVKVNPRSAQARKTLAFAYKAAEQYAESAAQFDAIYPLGVLNARETGTYVEMLCSAGQHDKSIKVLEDSIAKNPGAQGLYLQLANVQSAAGETPKAIQTCNRGIAISPKSAIGAQLVELRTSLLNGGGSSGQNPIDPPRTEDPGA